jgi:hypothetical protein
VVSIALLAATPTIVRRLGGVAGLFLVSHTLPPPQQASHPILRDEISALGGWCFLSAQLVAAIDRV